jgi:hypothetical protein
MFLLFAKDLRLEVGVRADVREESNDIGQLDVVLKLADLEDDVQQLVLEDLIQDLVLLRDVGQQRAEILRNVDELRVVLHLVLQEVDDLRPLEEFQRLLAIINAIPQPMGCRTCG